MLTADELEQQRRNSDAPVSRHARNALLENDNPGRYAGQLAHKVPANKAGPSPPSRNFPTAALPPQSTRMNTPHDDQPVITADELADLYNRDSELRNIHPNVGHAITDNEARLHNWTQALPGIVIITIFTGAASIALRAPAAAAVAAIIAVTATGATRALRREQQQLAHHNRAIGTERDHIAHVLGRLGETSSAAPGPHNPDATEQLCHIYKEAGTERPHPLHGATSSRRHQLQLNAVRATIPDSNFWDTLSRDPFGDLIRHIGADNLCALAHWPALGAHIASTWTFHTSAGAVNSYHHAAGTVRELHVTHGTDVLDTANQLAADDTNHQHHWKELVATATALTPQPV
jgi:hypothetical protein